MASCPYLISQSSQTHRQSKNSNSQGAGKVDCPIRKHNVMHGEPVTCSGCAATQMSVVRRHLSQSLSLHNRSLVFFKQCRNCKITVIDRTDWERGLHVAGECEYKPAPRESIVTAWARLYLVLYPSAIRVPNPYTDERGWLPDAIMTFIRSLHTTTPTSDNAAAHHPSISEVSNRRERITLATDVDDLPSPADSQESAGSITPDSPSMPLSQEFLSLISSDDDKSHATERVQDYLRSQLSLMPVREYAVIDRYLGTHCNVEGDEMDSAYGSVDVRTAQLRPQDKDDVQSMAKIDPWSRYNTRLVHTSEGAMMTPEEFEAQNSSIMLTESPSPLSLQSSESSAASSLETSIHDSTSKMKTEDTGFDSVHSDPPPSQPKGEHIPILEAYMNASQAKWDLSTYTRQWLNFIQRWDRIIEEMGSQGSTTTRDAFAQVLQSIKARLQLDNNNLPLFADHQGQQSHTTPGNQADATPSRTKRPRTEETPRSSEKESKRPRGAGGSEANDENRALVAQDDRIAKSEFLKFRCPVWMYHFKHNRTPTCKNWAGNELSQLDQRHLKPRGGGHANWIKFFKRCNNCKEFVKDEQLWERHQRLHCRWQDTAPRRRRANNICRADEDFILAAWARIYLTFFPEELDVPNPYVGQTGDIPRDLTDRFRAQVIATLPPPSPEVGPFLDGQQGGRPSPPLPPITIDDINFAATRVMMQDFINPSALTLDPASPRPPLDLGSISQDADPGLPVTSSPEMANQFNFGFKSKFDQGMETAFNAIDEASNCLTPIAHENFLDQVEAQFCAEVEARRRMRRPAVTHPVESTAILPDLIEPSQLALYVHGQVATSESSTQPSTRVTKTQGPSTNRTSLDDMEMIRPTTPPPQTVALAGTPQYPLKDMGGMGKELDQLATMDTQFAGTSFSEGFDNVDSFFNFDSASLEH